MLALVAANAISLMGNSVSAVALPWLVLVTTGSAAKTGVAAFATTVPFAVGGVFGGALSDRIGARRTSIVGDSLSTVAIGLIPLLYALGQLRFWEILALGFAKSVCDAPGTAARRALLPQLAEETETSLERANSLYLSTEHIGYLLGAPLAGAAIAALGAADVLWLDTASFALAALVVAAKVHPQRRVEAATAGYRRDLVAGLRFVRREPPVSGYLVLSMFGTFLAAWLAPVILPIYAREVLHSPVRLGLMVALFGLGGLTGTIIFGTASSRLGRRTAYLAPFLAYPFLILALVPLPPFPIVLLALFLFGCGVGLLAPLQQTVVQERTPPDLRGRVYGLIVSAQTASGSVGMIVGGFVVAAVGIRAALALDALGLAFLAIGALWNLRVVGAAYPAR